MSQGEPTSVAVAPISDRAPVVLYLSVLLLCGVSVVLSAANPATFLWNCAVWAAVFGIVGGVACPPERHRFIGNFFSIASDVLTVLTLLAFFRVTSAPSAAGALLLVGLARLSMGVARNREALIGLSCGLFSTALILALPGILRLDLGPLPLAAMVAVYYVAADLPSLKKSWFTGKSLMAIGHMTALVAAIWIVAARPVAPAMRCVTYLLFPAIFGVLLAATRRAAHLGGLLMFAALGYCLMAVEVFSISAGSALVHVAVCAVVLVVASRLLLTTAASAVRDTLYGVAGAISLVGGGAVLAVGKTGSARAVLVAGAVAYILLLYSTRAPLFLYLITLNLGLLAYGFLQASESIYTQDLFVYFVYCLVIVGYFSVHPYIKRAAKNRRILLLLTVADWKGILFYAAPASGIILILVVFFSTRIAGHPQFCRVCHYMAPFVDSWEVSSHKEVSCVMCHYEPGFTSEMKGKLNGLLQVVKYMSGSYSCKAHARVEDAICLREGCHTDMDKDTEILYANRVRFNHRHHVGEVMRGLDLRCVSCHSQIVHRERVKVTREVCVLCHFRGRGKGGVAVGGCRSCHELPQSKVLHSGAAFNHGEFLGDRDVACVSCHTGVTSGEGTVARERCLSCHMEAGQDLSDSKRLHKIHVSVQEMECFVCHLKMDHGSRAMESRISLNCNACHGPRHNVAEEMYRGTGAIDVKSSPDAMFLADVTCEGCHKYEESTQIGKHIVKARKAKPEACDACHEPGFGDMVAEWQAETTQHMEKLSETLTRVDSLLKGASVEALKEAEPLVFRARSNLAFVKEDGSRGAHNYLYSQAILESVKNDLSTVEKTLGGEHE